jgi:[ribosomal protein S18]-alanine N-acetyltransferase
VFVIRFANATDLEALIDIEQRSPEAAHWTRATHMSAIADRARLVLVAEDEANIAGFLMASKATDEWELENIAVAPERRRQGIGRALMAELISQARQAGAVEIRQEIRASNLAAQSLGRSAGFQRDGRRPAYYSNPTEDALLFKYLLNRPANLC